VAAPPLTITGTRTGDTLSSEQLQVLLVTDEVLS